MKKSVFLFALVCILSTANIGFATENFDKLEGITPAQRHQISVIQNEFKIKNNDLETKIMNYSDKIARLKSDSEKTEEQASLLIGAYERNIETYKKQQDILLKETNAKYKSILTDEQYKQYQAMQITVQDSFNKFLQK